MTLSSLYKSIIEKQNSPKEGLASFLFDNNDEKDNVPKLIKQYLAFKIGSFHDYLYFLRRILCLLIAIDQQKVSLSQEHHDLIVRKIEDHTYFKSIYITQALKQVIYHFLKIPQDRMKIKKFKNGNVLVSEGFHYPWTQLPSHQINCELSAILSLLGYLKDDDEYKENALNIAKWHLHLLDKDGFPLMGLWSQEETFDQIEVLCSYYLMSFSIGCCIDNSYLSIAKKIFVHIQNILETKQKFFPSFPVFMTFLIEKFLKPNDENEKLLDEEIMVDQDLAFISHRCNSFDATFSLYGLNSGIGSIHVKDVRIISCGPQHFPLSDSRGYGLYQTKGYSFDNDVVICEKNEEGCHLKGWTNLCRFMQQENGNIEAEKSSVWQELEIITDEKKCHLSANFFHQEIKEKLTFSFYIQAKTCHIGDKVFLSKSLDRYFGEAKEISFRGKSASISMKSLYVKKIHLIPLSGDASFWNANFLIAFEIDPNEAKCVIEISKV